MADQNERFPIHPHLLERAAWGVLLVILYVVLVCLPLLVAGIFHPEHSKPFLSELGKAFALSGTVLLALQIVLAARLRWIERPFGLDILFRFHRSMAVFAGGLILLHPVLLAAGHDSWGLLTSLSQPWPVLLGKLALFLLLMNVLVALLRSKLRIGFERWRAGHGLTFAVFLLVLVHAWILGDDLHNVPMRVFWMALAVLSGLAFVYHKVIVPLRSRKRAYVVRAIRRETHDVWTLEMEPPADVARFDFRPGQFQFLTPLRGERKLPVEEHPFTISSSPAETNLAASIKESGDFTRTIGLTEVGDRIAVRGPYGRFSHTFRPGDRDFVFIAGGIGITPLLSMLKYMHETNAEVEVLLIWGNQTKDDIAFREELGEVSAGEQPRVRIAHVLSKPDDDWKGERGFVDREKIERLVGEGLGDKTYYVCGPPIMMQKVFAVLRELGVAGDRIRFERFAL